MNIDLAASTIIREMQQAAANGIVVRCLVDKRDYKHFADELSTLLKTTLGENVPRYIDIMATPDGDLVALHQAVLNLAFADAFAAAEAFFKQRTN